MQSKLSVLSLVLAVTSMGVAGYALLENRSLRAELGDRPMHVGGEGEWGAEHALPADVIARLDAVEERVSETGRHATNQIIPGLPGLEGRERREPASASPGDVDADGANLSDEQLKTFVNEAVEKKARQLQQMQNKKPSFEAFAETLELNEVQRQEAEREVLRGQREMRSLLETPTEDGTIFLDEIVDTMALGMVKPGEAKLRFAGLLGRIIKERVPGTDTTYGERAEQVKQTVRDAFEHSWSQTQYARFQQWKMDPTEVQGIEGSPWEELGPRIIERARQLGAKIPDNAGR